MMEIKDHEEIVNNYFEALSKKEVEEKEMLYQELDR